MSVDVDYDLDLDDEDFLDELMEDDSEDLEDWDEETVDASEDFGYSGADPVKEPEEKTNNDQEGEFSGSALESEYDSTFTGEEQIEQMFSSVSGRFQTSFMEIPVDSIILPKFKKEMRQKTVIGLTGIVGSFGAVVTPIHVMTMEDADDEYILLEGTRRLYSALKSGHDTVRAIVWDFEDRDEASRMANILSLILNRSQALKNSEIWSTLRVLEVANNCTPGKIEYLLQLRSGDAMKLKDVMLAEGGEEVQEMREKFLNDEFTIDAAYKKLTNIRKKEDRLERDENRTLASATSDDSDVFSSPTPESSDHKVRLDNDEVLELLEMGEEDVTDQTLDDMKAKGEALREEAGEDAPHVQEVGKRHPVDRKIRTDTFKRDNFKCVCGCGIGGELYLSVLVYHHRIPVFAGGPDTVDNGLTMCANCHLTLHNYVDGLLHGDLDAYDEEGQKVLRKIFQFGNVAIAASKKMGLKRAKVRELNADSRKHIMPNKNVKANDESFFGSDNSSNADDNSGEAEDED